MKQTLVNNIKNIPGKRIKDKVIAIECDDWGGIRMPSKAVYLKMLNYGIPVDKCRYSSFDVLEEGEDLLQLFEILLSVKDKNGNPAVMTPVVNVANPDFSKIKESGFTQYFYEPFTDTLKRYYPSSDTFTTWKEGIRKGIFVPEFHGREHISVHFWLQKLRDGDSRLRTAFDHGFLSIHVDGIHPAISKFRPEFYFNDLSQVEFLKESISDGVDLFRFIFGYTPHSFVPSNSIFHPLFEQSIAEAGVKYLYVGHQNPTPDKNGNLKRKYYRIGKKTREGIIYYTRNCAFEPTDMSYRGIDLTMRQIEAAFRWGKPANISTHRVNFVGGIDIKNREKGLSELRILLNAIVKKWPEVQFKSSADMLKILYEEV